MGVIGLTGFTMEFGWSCGEVRLFRCYVPHARNPGIRVVYQALIIPHLMSLGLSPKIAALVLLLMHVLTVQGAHPCKQASVGAVSRTACRPL